MKKNIDKTLREASYWAYAAWTAPFVALAVLIGEILIGTDSVLGATSIAVVVTFVTTSVFWWWWAITKIVYMVKMTSQVEQNFDELKKELTKLNKDLNK